MAVYQPQKQAQLQQMPVYFESFLEKKEKKWISYWVVLRGPHLWFFKDRTSDIKKFVGRLDLGPNSQVQADKTKKNNCQFTLTSVRGLYRLKTVSDEMRRKWISVINMAARGMPPPGSPSQPTPAPAPISGYPPQSAGYPSPHNSAQFYPPPRHQYPGSYPPHPPPGHYPAQAATMPADRPPPLPPGGPTAKTMGRRPPQPLPDEPPPLPSSSRPGRKSSEPLLPGQRIALEEQKRLEQENALLPGQKIALEEERRRIREETMKKRRSEPALRSPTALAPPPLPPPNTSGGSVIGPYVDMAPGPNWKMNETKGTGRPPLPTPALDVPDEDEEGEYISPWENADWFYSPLSREKAEELLHTRGSQGSFLIRESESRKGEFSLSIIREDKIRHYKITKTTTGFVLSGNDAQSFQDLSKLVAFYEEMNKGAAHPLLKTDAVLHKPSPQVPNPTPAEIDKFDKELSLKNPSAADADDADYLDLADDEEKVERRPAPLPPAEERRPAPPPPAEERRPAPPPPAEERRPAPPPPAEEKCPAPPPPAEEPPPSSDDEDTTGYENVEFDETPSQGPTSSPPITPSDERQNTIEGTEKELYENALFSTADQQTEQKSSEVNAGKQAEPQLSAATASPPVPLPPTEPPPPDEDEYVEDLYDEPDPGKPPAAESKPAYMNTAGSDAYLAEDALD